MLRRRLSQQTKPETPAATPAQALPVKEKIIPAELIILFIVILAVGFFVRAYPILVAESQLKATYGRYFLFDDDSWWHQHLIDQILQYGRRLDPDPATWAPEGRPMSHPPGYHYLIAFLAKLFAASSFNVAFWFGPFAGIIGIIVCFLLFREIYGIIGGFMGASIYAVSYITIIKTAAGISRPAGITEAILIFGLWLFFYTERTGRKFLLPIPGLVLGISALFWEGTLYFYLPIIATYWILGILAKKATKQFNLLCLTTILVSGLIASLWYYHIFATFGLDAHANTPASVLKTTLFYQTEGIWDLIIGGANVFFPAALIIYLILVVKALKNKQTLMKNYLALVWMTLGLAALLLGFGRRFVDIFLIYGIIAVCAYGVATYWNKFSKGKLIIALFISIILLANAGVHVYEISEYYAFYEPYLDMTKITGKELPENATVMSWFIEGAFITGIGARNVWDLYLQWVPSWAKTRDKVVSTFYLATNETEALAVLKSLNTTYVFVGIPYCRSLRLGAMLQAKAINAKPEDYFKSYTPATGGASEFGPTEKGRNIMTTRLIWNSQTGNILKQLAMPDAPSAHFQLVWKSQDLQIFLYKVIQ